MKPFNLEEAKAGKSICTRNGKKARIICFDRIDNCGGNFNIVALVSMTRISGEIYREEIYSYDNNGYNTCGSRETYMDLMMEN